MHKAIYDILMKMPKSAENIYYVHKMDHMGVPLGDYYANRDNFIKQRTTFSPFAKFPPECLTDEEKCILKEITHCYSLDAADDADADAADVFVNIGLSRIASCLIFLKTDLRLLPVFETPRIRVIIKEIMDAENHRDDNGTVDMLIDTIGVDTDGYTHNPITLIPWINAVIRQRLDDEAKRKRVTTIEKTLKGLNLVIKKFAEEDLAKRVDDLEGKLKESKNLLKETDAKHAGAQFEIFRLGNQVNDLEGRVKDGANLEILRLGNEKQESFQEENRILSSRVRVLEEENAQLELSIQVMTDKTDKTFVGRRVTRSNSKCKSPIP